MIYAMLSLAVLLHVVDWLQTRWISVNGAASGIVEINPILGPAPSINQADKYFLWSALALDFAAMSHYFYGSIPIAYGVLIAWALVEAWAVTNNIRLKIGFHFPV